MTLPDPASGEAVEHFVAWLGEWREVARVAVQRRDYRIALGLAQRRQRRSGEECDDGEDAGSEGGEKD